MTRHERWLLERLRQIKVEDAQALAEVVIGLETVMGSEVQDLKFDRRLRIMYSSPDW